MLILYCSGPLHFNLRRGCLRTHLLQNRFDVHDPREQRETPLAGDGGVLPGALDLEPPGLLLLNLGQGHAQSIPGVLEALGDFLDAVGHRPDVPPVLLRRPGV